MENATLEIFGSAAIGAGKLHPAVKREYDSGAMELKILCGCAGTRGGFSAIRGAYRFYAGSAPECKRGWNIVIKTIEGAQNGK